MSTHDARTADLRQRLGRLLQRVGKIEGDLRASHDADWVERATETENDEVLEGLDALTLLEVRQVRAALRRIETGQYGVCAGCGQPIGATRLAAIPTAVTCLHCAGKQ